MDDIYQDLSKKHADSYSVPKLRLWARMIHCGTHDSLEKPPPVLMIVGTPSSKKPRKEGDAAVAFTKAVQSPTQQGLASESTIKVGISPGKAIDLRSKNLLQLRTIQQLLEEKVLSDEELIFMNKNK